jgi:hypothetical protein
MWIFVLRVLGAQTPSIAPSDAPPPPAETRIAAYGDDDGDGDGDDPSDLDDDDSPDDDVALPTRLGTSAPGALAHRPSWSIHLGTDKHTSDPLFRPPRAA